MHSLHARPRVAVVQDGARLHYAVPKALAMAGMLERMYSEWFINPGSVETVVAQAVGWVSRNSGRRLSDRRCADIPRSRVVANPILGAYEQIARRWISSHEHYYNWCSEQVARWIKRVGWGQANAIFGFVRNIHPTVCAMARGEGLSVVTDQMIAPAAVEQSQFRLEQARWPEWGPAGACHDFQLVDAIEKRTWAMTDHVTCASEYVRNGLIGCGVPAGRVSVIRYPLQAEEFSVPDRSGRVGPINVGFVGHVGLRKGAPYFMAVARRLAGRGIRFTMVGPVAVVGPARAELAHVTELTGAIPRSSVRALLGKFDLFLFPSTCEGSAGAVAEAMAAGLPVVTSHNSGTLVEDGVHGFLRNYDDVDGMAEAIDRLATDASLRREMAVACRRAAGACNLDSYGRQLSGVFTRLAACSLAGSTSLTPPTGQPSMNKRVAD